MPHPNQRLAKCLSVPPRDLVPRPREGPDGPSRRSQALPPSLEPPVQHLIEEHSHPRSPPRPCAIFPGTLPPARGLPPETPPRNSPGCPPRPSSPPGSSPAPASRRKRGPRSIPRGSAILCPVPNPSPPRLLPLGLSTYEATSCSCFSRSLISSLSLAAYSNLSSSAASSISASRSAMRVRSSSGSRGASRPLFLPAL